jgi:hypothetical protein
MSDHRRRFCVSLLGCLVLSAVLAGPVGAAADDADVIDRAPTAKDWADIGKLPDWSGSWNSDQQRQHSEVKSNPFPWTPKATVYVNRMMADAQAGHPHNLNTECLPEGMPTWVLINDNTIEYLFTPGRVTVLGETDGNYQRRIFTDGRQHPKSPDPTFFGHSIGHWEGDTLVVDTVGVMPGVVIAPDASYGSPNNGDMHIVEHIHLAKPDELHDDMVVEAPHVFTKPWSTTRILYRQRKRKYEFEPGVCTEGNFIDNVDKDGNHVLTKVQVVNGVLIPP